MSSSSSLSSISVASAATSPTISPRLTAVSDLRLSVPCTALSLLSAASCLALSPLVLGTSDCDSYISCSHFHHSFLFAMRGSGGRPEPAFCGWRTAACDAGIDRIPAVFGLPFDTLKFDFSSSLSFAEKRELHSYSAFKFHIGLTPSLFIFQDAVKHSPLI